MKSFPNLRHSGHRVDDTIGHIVRMGTHEADALYARHTGGSLEQVREIRVTASGAITVIGVHGLAQQRDFASALADAVPHFGENLLHRMVALAASNRRHD